MKNAENSSDFAFVLISGPPNRRLDALAKLAKKRVRGWLLGVLDKS